MNHVLVSLASPFYIYTYIFISIDKDQFERKSLVLMLTANRVMPIIEHGAFSGTVVQVKCRQDIARSCRLSVTSLVQCSVIQGTVPS